MEKFPGDFVFQLDSAEADSQRIHFASLEKGRGTHRKHAPLVFTEHGAAAEELTDCSAKFVT
jgi:ORF6N domain-containing protein